MKKQKASIGGNYGGKLLMGKFGRTGTMLAKGLFVLVQVCSANCSEWVTRKLVAQFSNTTSTQKARNMPLKMEPRKLWSGNLFFKFQVNFFAHFKENFKGIC